MLPDELQIAIFIITLVLAIIAIYYARREYKSRIDNKDYVIRTLIHESTILSNVITSTFSNVEEVFKRKCDKVSVGELARFFDQAHNKIYSIRETMYGTITSGQFDLFLNFANSAESFMTTAIGLKHDNAESFRIFLENDIKGMANFSVSIQKEFSEYFSEGRNLSFTLHIPKMRDFIRKK